MSNINRGALQKNNVCQFTIPSGAAFFDSQIARVSNLNGYMLVPDNSKLEFKFEFGIFMEFFTAY